MILEESEVNDRGERKMANEHCKKKTPTLVHVTRISRGVGKASSRKTGTAGLDGLGVVVWMTRRWTVLNLGRKQRGVH